MSIRFKHIILICLLVINAAGVFAQCLTSKEKKLQRKVYTKVEVMPKFPGGPDGWQRFLEKSLQLPDNFGADSCGIQLTYECSMIVEPDGSLNNITINNECDTNRFCAGEKMCFYTLKKGPKWLPGKQNKKIVAVRINRHIGVEVGEL